MILEDYYRILKVSKSASDRKIRRSARKLGTKLHPKNLKEEILDRPVDFSKIVEAYLILSDEKSKLSYDVLLDVQNGKRKLNQRAIDLHQQLIAKRIDDAKGKTNHYSKSLFEFRQDLEGPPWWEYFNFLFGWISDIPS